MRKHILVILTFMISVGGFAERNKVPGILSMENQLQQALVRGQWTDALHLIQNPYSSFTSKSTTSKTLNERIFESTIYQKIGLNRKALNLWLEIDDQSSSSNDLRQHLLCTLGLIESYLSLNNPSIAESLLGEAMETAIDLGDPSLLSRTLFSQGNLEMHLKKFEDAIVIYQKAARLAKNVAEADLRTRIAINTAIAALSIKNLDVATENITFASKQLFRIPYSYEQAELLLSLGVLANRLDKEFRENVTKSDWKQLSWQSFSQVKKIAEELNNHFLLSSALGYLGKMYEVDARYSEAIPLTNRAVFLSRQTQFPEYLFLWQWQMARILNKTRNIQKAIAMYEKALQTLDPIRLEILNSSNNSLATFHTLVEPVYYELANLYFQQAKETREAPLRIRSLQQGRAVIEKFKSVELKDYFRNECLVELKQKTLGLEQLSKQTAVLYPIIFEDRVEILISLPNGLQNFSVKIEKEKIKELIHDLRKKLEIRTKKTFLTPARELYKILILPFREQLQEFQVDSLVIVPDGHLKILPFSALHNGERFLIEEFSLVKQPSLSLVDPKPFKRENLHSLVVGLSEPVQGFPALPNVDSEIAALHELIGGDAYLNQGFTYKNLVKEFKKNSYRIIHMATHGEFSSDPKNTFLLTHNGRLTIDQLENLIKSGRFREDPVELLTLSACRTASGDVRSALGLAGAALKSGARSILASLWFVDDAATKRIMTQFYKELMGNTNLSKAQALQNSQKKLLSDPRFKHPYYWSAFILIGNWL